MAANTNPIFTITPNVSTDNGTTLPAHVVSATGDYTGVSANHVKVFTAGANGSIIQRLRLVPEGTNVASVLRIYINNGSSQGTAANNVLWGMISLPATTANDAAALQEIDYPMNLVLPNGYTVWVGLGTAVAAGWRVTGVGGNY